MAMSLPVVRSCCRDSCHRHKRRLQALFTNCRPRLLSSTAQKVLEDDKLIDQCSDGNAYYPPIKPKFPPGLWGDMDHKYAWKWHEMRENLLSISDVPGRLNFINSSKMTSIDAIPFHDHPDYLKFAKFITKTVVFPWNEQKPQIYSEIEAELEKSSSFERIKKTLIDQIVLDKEIVVREKSNIGQMQAKLILRCIADTLMSGLSHDCKHLITSSYDEDCIVRTLWDRHGIERNRRVRIGPGDKFTIKSVLDHRVNSSCVFDAMVRSDTPLPELVDREGGLSTESKAPSLDHKLGVYGVPKHKLYQLKSLLAGHILGDPCEYGLVGLVSNFFRGDQLNQQFGIKTAQDCRLGRGLLMTFSWLAAQAYNQGFSPFVDLSYPLVSQTILSDGRNFSFLACQLNTLELWKSDDANKLVNLCWHTEEMPLYDCIENQQIKGFNNDVLKKIMTMFLVKPSVRGYDMKPTITDKDSDLHRKQDFIPYKEDVVDEGPEEEQYIVT